MSGSGSQEAAPNGSDSPTKRAPRPAVGNRVTVVLGAQWGDEGKGKVVDLLAQDADMVCRCQASPLKIVTCTTALTGFLLSTLFLPHITFKATSSTC